MSWLYELGCEEPARFRAAGLDAAHRVAGRVREAVNAALAADPEVVAVEDEIWLRERAQRCDRTARCRAGLHEHGCAAEKRGTASREDVRARMDQP